MVPYSLRALSISSFVGLSLLATHGRPSTMITFSAPSWATTQVPTIGSNVAGGLPTCSLLRSTFMSAATQRRHDSDERAHEQFPRAPAIS